MGKNPIHLFRPRYHVEETLDEIRQCLELGWTGLGFKTVEFEEAWKGYTGLECAHFLNSATSGLHLAVLLLKERFGWGEGDEVVTTPLTFVSTNHAILHAGMKPVFADVDEYLCLDPDSVESRITDRTRAVMFVGLGGNAGRLAAVAEVCRKRGLKLILDAAHMAGTRLGGRHVGREGDAAVFSFQAVKNLPTADSGMICFNDPALDAEARHWTWLGIDKDTFTRTHQEGAYKWHYDVVHPGYKYHGNSVIAAMGLVALKYLDEDNAYRREIAGWYDSALSGRTGVETVPVGPDCLTSRHLYQVLVEDRDEVILRLNDEEIYPGCHYRSNTLYRMYADMKGTCPRAESASDRVISLPLHPGLTEGNIERVCDTLLRILGRP